MIIPEIIKEEMQIHKISWKVKSWNKNRLNEVIMDTEKANKSASILEFNAINSDY